MSGPSLIRNARWLTLAALIGLAGCATDRSTLLEGFRVEDRFAECPESPNCVSSYATDSIHRVEPLPLPASDPMGTLIEVVNGFPRTEIVTQDGDYLHATFRSLVFRFVDDVEFQLDHEAGVIHVRSASRVGYGDLNVNRNRVESIRARLSQPEVE